MRAVGNRHASITPYSSIRGCVARRAVPLLAPPPLLLHVPMRHGRAEGALSTLGEVHRARRLVPPDLVEEPITVHLHLIMTAARDVDEKGEQ